MYASRLVAPSAISRTNAFSWGVRFNPGSSTLSAGMPLPIALTAASGNSAAMLAYVNEIRTHSNRLSVAVNRLAARTYHQSVIPCFV
jgi:hypothetical protein